MAEAKGDKFVVLHGAISHGGKTFLQGQVIGRKDLEHVHEVRDPATGKVQRGEPEDLHDRYVGLRAIRPASAEEAAHETVDVSGAPLALSPLAQAELAARDARIEQMTRQVGDLQDRIKNAAALGPAASAAPQPADPAEAAMLKALAAEKDAKIEALAKRIEDLEKVAAERAKEQAQAGEKAAGRGGSPAPPHPPPKK